MILRQRWKAHKIVVKLTPFLEVQEMIREIVGKRDGVILDPKRNEREGVQVALEAEDFSECFAKLSSHCRRWINLEGSVESLGRRRSRNRCWPFGRKERRSSSRKEGEFPASTTLVCSLSFSHNSSNFPSFLPYSFDESTSPSSTLYPTSLLESDTRRAPCRIPTTFPSSANTSRRSRGVFGRVRGLGI